MFAPLPRADRPDRHGVEFAATSAGCNLLLTAAMNSKTLCAKFILGIATRVDRDGDEVRDQVVGHAGGADPVDDL